MKTRTGGLLLVLVLMLAAVAPLQAADPVVLRVVVVESDQPEAYVAEIAKGKALMKRMGSSAEIRVWRARFAGPEAGLIVVSIEYPSLAAFAADDAKAAADPDFQAWLRGLDKVRKIVSDSLYTELGG